MNARKIATFATTTASSVYVVYATIQFLQFHKEQNKIRQQIRESEIRQIAALKASSLVICEKIRNGYYDPMNAEAVARIQTDHEFYVTAILES